MSEGLNHPRKDAIADFARGSVLIRVGGSDYTADVVVGTRKNGSMILYDILNLQPTAIKEKETTAAISANPSPGAASSTAAVSTSSVAENTLPVKEKKEIPGSPVAVFANRNPASKWGSAGIGAVSDPLMKATSTAFENIIRDAGGSVNSRADEAHLDEDEKRTDTWLMSLGLQLPSGQPAYGPVGSISYDSGYFNI